jgi:hypothetical protein
MTERATSPISTPTDHVTPALATSLTDTVALALDAAGPKHEPGKLHWDLLIGQTRIWINRDGEEIRIADMSDEYLTRVIWMLRDRGYWYYSDLAFELERRSWDKDPRAIAELQRLRDTYGPLPGEPVEGERTARSIMASYDRWIDDQPLVREMIRRLGYAPTERPGPREQ